MGELFPWYNESWGGGGVDDFVLAITKTASPMQYIINDPYLKQLSLWG